MSGPYKPLWREMEEKYLESENLWWMCERPEDVLLDISRMIESLEWHDDYAKERDLRD